MPEQGSGLSSLGRIIRTHKVCVVVVVVVSPCVWQIPVFEGQRQVEMSTAATAAALPATSSSSAPPSSASSSPSPSSSPSSSTVDVSTMERLLLGEAPCHQIIFKLSALKGGGVLGTRSKANKHGRDRMMGHSIIFPHFVMGERRGQAFSLDAIKAAFSTARLVLVGPQDQQSQLEKAALKIYDLRVRPEVVYNFLALNHRLHGGPEPPTLEAFQRLLDLHGGLAAHLKSVHTRRVTDEHAIDV